MPGSEMTAFPKKQSAKPFFPLFVPDSARRTFKVVSAGGIGEALLMTPVFRALKQRYPASKIHVFCINWRHQEVYRNNPHIDRIYRRDSASFWHSPFWFLRERLKPPSYIRPYYGRLTPAIIYQKHASMLIADMVGLTLIEPKMELFLDDHEQEQAKKALSPYEFPIIIHTTAAFTSNKDWLHDRWQTLVKRNPQYAFLQIGLESEKLVPGAFDFRGKSLRKQFSLIKFARGFIGVDSVFAHAASALDTPAVVLFGPTPVVIWGNHNNINLQEPVRCSPCVDFLQTECPYGKPCMTALTVEHVEVALSQALLRTNRSQLP